MRLVEREPSAHSSPSARSALGSLLMVLLLSGCWSTNYLLSQAGGQLRLLQARRNISAVLADPDLDGDLRQRLQLAAAARRFGVEVLGLRGGDNYTRFLDLHGGPVAWNLSAAPKDRLRPLTWRFPITGAVPYLGFFTKADADRQAAILRAKDYDVYVREVSGYSTLGLTADPIYSSMLEGSPARIVEVVLHEMFHGTVYLSGKSAWNESLATFVGLHGAALFFAMTSKGSAGQRVYAEARATARLTKTFEGFLRPYFAEAEALYAKKLPRAETLRLRQELFDRMRDELLRRWPPRPGHTPAILNAEGGGINNAVLASYGVYHHAAPDHARLYRRLRSDLPAFIALHKLAVEMYDPLGYLAHIARPDSDLDGVLSRR